MMHEEFYVYILKCSDGSYYVGQTDDISRRHGEHMEKIVGVDSYVLSRLPAKLVYAECTQTRDSAKNAERMIKGWTRQKKEALIKGGWEAVAELCKKLKQEKRLLKNQQRAGYKDDPSTASFDSLALAQDLLRKSGGDILSHTINLTPALKAFASARSSNKKIGENRHE